MDSPAFAVALTAMIAAAALVSYLLARRPAKLDPVETPRADQ
jgi:hypothetical protein